MRNKLLLILFLIFTTSTVSAQFSYTIAQENNDVKVKCKWKENNGKQELYIKYKTVGGSNLNIDLELGFFLNGIQKENAQISDCIKRFFWNNWFRPLHVIQLEDFTKSDIESDQFTFEIMNLTVEKVDKCTPTHD